MAQVWFSSGPTSKRGPVQGPAPFRRRPYRASQGSPLSRLGWAGLSVLRALATLDLDALERLSHRTPHRPQLRRYRGRVRARAAGPTQAILPTSSACCHQARFPRWDAPLLARFNAGRAPKAIDLSFAFGFSPRAGREFAGSHRGGDSAGLLSKRKRSPKYAPRFAAFFGPCCKRPHRGRDRRDVDPDTAVRRWPRQSARFRREPCCIAAGARDVPPAATEPDPHYASHLAATRNQAYA
jgi:hypothetical protein